MSSSQEKMIDVDPNKIWINEEDKKFINNELKRYESKYSAIIPSLYQIQRRHGWVGVKAVKELSEISELPESHINEVLQFYTMFNKKPVGKLHAQVCTNVSCAMNGGRELAKHLCKTFDVGLNEMSKDGLITINQVECLGACHNAPMMQVGDNYYENLTPESAVKKLLELGKVKN